LGLGGLSTSIIAEGLIVRFDADTI
jgi:hypothetical protein